MTAVIILGMIFSVSIRSSKSNIQTLELQAGNVDKKFDFIATPEYQKCKAGDTAEINLSIENVHMGEVGLNNVVGYLSYDEALFEEVNVTCVDNWNFEYNQDKSHEMYGKFVLYTMHEGVTEAQNIATIALKLKDDVAPQKTQVTFLGLNSSDGETYVEEEYKTAVIEIYKPSQEPSEPEIPDVPEVPEQPKEQTIDEKPESEKIEETPEYTVTYSPKTGDNVLLLTGMLAIATIVLNVLVITKKNTSVKGRVGIVSAIVVIAIGLVAFAVTSFAHNGEITTLIEGLSFEEKWLNSEKYLVTDETVSRIAPLTNVSSITDKFNKEITVYEKDSNESVTDGIVKTGMRISDGEANYEAVALGDVSGDGESNTIDLTNIIRNVVDSNKFGFSNVKKLAGDMNVEIQ